MTTSRAVEVLPSPEQLDRWLHAQVWFRGRGPVECSQVTFLRDGDPVLVHVVLACDGRRYQLLLGVRDELPERLVHAQIGTAGDRPVYEAVYDPELTAVLLDHFEASSEVADLRFRGALAPRYTAAPVGRPFSGPQRNRSIVYGQRHVLKFFRELTPGDNPELVLLTALDSVEDPHIARPQGALETDLDGVRTTLAVLNEFVPLGALGWPMATASVRDFLAVPGDDPAAAGGDFAAEAHRLGRAVARVHADLRTTLGDQVAGPDDEAEFVSAMHSRLDAALAEVPRLEEFEAGLRARFDAVLETAGPIRLQRVHGDLHLGQVLRSPRAWVLVDFEGVPHGDAVERSRPRPAAYDVATVLRSLHYAAAQLLVGADDVDALLPLAARWLGRNRTAFCDGYSEVSADLRRDDVLLTAVELDRAVLEVRHENRFRPEWTVIPLSAIAEVVTGEPVWTA
ncbi:maltokinase N-terminal cap-like domain-containing protein [Lentzea sp.]|uniref:maltokinase N-terminal cap-like domain-containing protein n=1 Tax=Lentzea sp. TaxID=56099 RepID=UPI002BE86CD8|nr:aminoglycoside phosphotransferase [Lentzea sp.]HUQ57030.1 aminoglycoside phosphotransferase [Lentzea sp.]